MSYCTCVRSKCMFEFCGQLSSGALCFGRLSAVYSFSLNAEHDSVNTYKSWIRQVLIMYCNFFSRKHLTFNKYMFLENRRCQVYDWNRKKDENLMGNPCENRH